jgi:exonuclease III
MLDSVFSVMPAAHSCVLKGKDVMENAVHFQNSVIDNVMCSNGITDNINTDNINATADMCLVDNNGDLSITKPNCQNDSNTHITSGNSNICSITKIDNSLVSPLDTTKLNVMVWNINGLGCKLSNKDFLDYVSRFEIVIFLETMKLDTFVPVLNNFEFKHFQRKFQHPRARKPAGGIGIMIHSDWCKNNTVTVIKNSDFAVWLKIRQFNEPDVYLGAVYIPPLDSTSTISSFPDNNAYHLLQDDITHFSQAGNVIICGDFNARTGRQSDYQHTFGNDNHDIMAPSYITSSKTFPPHVRHSDDNKVNQYGKELLELCKSSNLRIMNGYFNNDSSTGSFTCYTANGRSLIDYLICDICSHDKLTDFGIEPLSSNSDHRPLVFSYSLSVPMSKDMKTVKKTGPPRERFYKYVFNAERVPSLIDSLGNGVCLSLYDKFVEDVISDNGVNNAVNDIYAVLHTAISQNFSRKYQRSLGNTFPKNEWFDDDCKFLKRKINDYPKNHNLDINDNLAEYMKLKKEYRAKIQRKKREYQNNIRNQLNSMEVSNPQEYWRYWDRLKKDSKMSLVGAITLEDFDNYFQSVQSPPDRARSKFDMQFLDQIEKHVNQYNRISQKEPLMTDAPISAYEVKNELISLKNGKAPGIDGICNEFYKYLSDYMVEPLTILFNYVWEKGIYPDKWSEGIIQPLHKKGSRNEPDNYRKLTLMACMGKIFEAIINKRLVFQSEATNSIDHNQFGFCKGCRTSDNVFIIDTLISHQKSKKKPLYITFVDFSKAFDFVNRTFLYYKLIQHGYGGKLLKIVQSLFEKSSARVRWNGQLGPNIDSTFGVLQGGIISPKLFNLYLADISNHLNQSHGITVNETTFTHLLYADDLILISESAIGMQVLIDDLIAYCKKWHLIINSDKTKVMTFSGRRNSEVSATFFLDGEILEPVNSYKYLGHIISNAPKTYNLMYEHLATQAQKAMHAMKENIKSIVGYLPPNLNLKMFDTHILPILEYNSEIWFSVDEINVIEKIQLKFLKNLLGVRRQTSTIAVLADTGRFPLLYRQQASAIKYFHRLKSKDCPLLVKLCYDIQSQLHQGNHKCWLTRLYETLGNINENYDSLSHTELNMQLYSKAQEKMMQRIDDSNVNPKLRTYKLFKTEVRIEPYLNFNLPRNIYKSIARFRLSSHNLHIELGRHKRPYIPANERHCRRCDSDLVEDEFHCLMICKKWDNLRISLLEKASEHIENFLVLSLETQFIKIVSSKNQAMIHALGKFLFEVLSIDNTI